MGLFSKIKPNVFNYQGLSICLDNSFQVDDDNENDNLLILSNDYFVVVNAESGDDIVEMGISSLTSYINAVLQNNGVEDAEIEECDEGETPFYYALYTAEVEGDEFGYMLTVFEGDEYCYAVIFGCDSKVFEQNVEKFIEWAKTITIDE